MKKHRITNQQWYLQWCSNGVPPDDLPEFWPGIFWKLELVESFWVDQWLSDGFLVVVLGVIPGPSQDAPGTPPKDQCQVCESGSRSPGWQSGQSQWHLDGKFGGKKHQTQIANPLKQTSSTGWLTNSQCSSVTLTVKSWCFDIFRRFSRWNKPPSRVYRYFEIEKKDGHIQGT